MTAPAARRYRSIMADSARWESIRFRDGDIVISTPPKCGTTWIQMITALIVFQDIALPRRLTEMSPWIDVLTEKIETVVADIDEQDHRRFLKSHTPYDGLPHDDGVTYICVGRDPRDVALSWANHFANMNLEAVIGARAAAVGLEDLAEFMADGPPLPPDNELDQFWQWIDDDTPLDTSLTSLAGTLHHLHTFWTHRDDRNVVLFHYGDLQRDLDGEMRRLSAALGVAVDESRWPSLVDAACFENMRSRADELAPQVKVDNFWNDTTQFFHRGATGQWLSFLGRDDLARYERRVAALVPPDLAEWAHHGSNP